MSSSTAMVVIHRIVAIVLLPYIMLVSINSADVDVGINAVSDAGTADLTTLSCIEQGGMDFDTEAQTDNEQDTPSKAPTMGDVTINEPWSTRALYGSIMFQLRTTIQKTLDGVTLPRVPPPDRMSRL
jgi:hypothetical protein